ncbi:AraC family transcriptional regulator [Tistrella mobilis]|jgi:AraC-like DNA-binding protein|uniref:AraC family transcriptional regulator n=1 Tax=Tistrella mobilis TaxID=171437 RepID=UPI0035583E98
MDPLSDVLSILKPRRHMSAGFDAGGDWSVRFSGQDGSIKCGAVVSGDCWLAVDGVSAPFRLAAGDGFLLPRGRPFTLASDPALPPVDAKPLIAHARDGGIVTCNGGGDTMLISSRFSLDGDHAALLMRQLPPVVHLRKRADRVALRWCVMQMMQELKDPRPGGLLLLRHLAHMMLVQALRLHLSERGEGDVGWFAALTDRQIGKAVAAIHDDPGHRWTLPALAQCAGMSRSTFAQRFRDLAGMAPMDYVTRWRMLLAGDRLEAGSDPVSVIALSLGYESESAFSTAFKRVMGCAPRQYGRRRNGGRPSDDDLAMATGAGLLDIDVIAEGAG